MKNYRNYFGPDMKSTGITENKDNCPSAVNCGEITPRQFVEMLLNDSYNLEGLVQAMPLTTNYLNGIWEFIRKDTKFESADYAKEMETFSSLIQLYSNNLKDKKFDDEDKKLFREEIREMGKRLREMSKNHHQKKMIQRSVFFGVGAVLVTVLGIMFGKSMTKNDNNTHA